MILEEKGFRRTLRKQGRDLKMLTGPSAGKPFRATVNRIGAFTLSELDTDVRGKRILEMPADNEIQIGSQDEILDLASLEKYFATEINLDSPVYSKKFVLQQMSENDAP